KVGVGTLASLALYEDLLGRDTLGDATEGEIAAWPDLDAVLARVDAVLGTGDLADKAREEMRAKHPTRDAVRDQRARAVAAWPEIRERLR
ncbi:hypothetical protein NL425_26535, partial [Klebsiella pneumoniae]|nr:hypothetical protein [Klebsiella pneumoniae]